MEGSGELNETQELNPSWDANTLSTDRGITRHKKGRCQNGNGAVLKTVVKNNLWVRILLYLSRWWR